MTLWILIFLFAAAEISDIDDEGSDFSVDYIDAPIEEGDMKNENAEPSVRKKKEKEVKKKEKPKKKSDGDVEIEPKVTLSFLFFYVIIV